MPTTASSKKMLRQVLLKEYGGTKQDVFWIDNEYARVGKKLKDDDGRMWVVAEAYNAKAFDDVDKQREAWKRWADVLDGH